MRQATAIVCDDLLVSMNGKMTLLGVYTSDMGIPAEGHRLNQLIFLFIVEGDLSDPLKSLKVQVKLPSGSSAEAELPILENVIARQGDDRTRWIAKVPLALQAPIMSAGKIEARVIHDQGQIDVVLPWIVLTPPATPG
jgi:hypothetical protein